MKSPLHSMLFCLSALLLALNIVLPQSAGAVDVYVSLAGDGSDGRSWETAFTNIQSAVDAVTSSGTIQIASGTYALDAEITFASKTDVTVRGAGAGNTVIAPAASATTRLLNITTSTNCTFSGLTLTGGRIVVASSQSALGGGVAIADSGDLHFIDCEVVGNQAENLAGSEAVPAQGGGFWVVNSIVAINRHAV